MTDVRHIEPLTDPPDVSVRVPGSKSITNRALLAAALATGSSRLDGVLVSDDTLAMVGCLRAVGIHVELDEDAHTARVVGCGGQVPPGPAEVDVRLSGTTARFIAPALALGTGDYVIDGAAPFRARPMGPLFTSLRALGVEVEELGRAGHLPARITATGLRGGRVRIAGDVSSQFLSGLLLAGPAMPDGLEIELTTGLVSVPYVELTLATMRAFGAAVEQPAPDRFLVGPQAYRSATFAIEPDASAASYFFAAAAITGGSVRVEGLTRRASQGDVRFVDVLERMGAQVVVDDTGIEVRGTGQLVGVEVDLADLSDVAQTLAAVAVFADGPTRVTGIGFIRAKETDRIRAVVTELRRCGIDAIEEDDGFVIHPGAPRPTLIETYDDHRMAMSFSLLGLVAPGIRIADPGCVAKTFPGFFSVLDELRGSGTASPR